MAEFMCIKRMQLYTHMYMCMHITVCVYFSDGGVSYNVLPLFMMTLSL